jgi:peptidoglycan/xylan/chitin deacetylase (PgdA/CDA1 family)
MPYALDTNDMKMWIAPALTPQQWLDYAVDTFDWLYQEGKTAPRMMSVGLHLRIIGRPGRIGSLEKLLQHVRSRDSVWIATRKEIADYWTKSSPPNEGSP